MSRRRQLIPLASLLPIIAALVAGCAIQTDPATRLAADLEAGADLLGSDDGDSFNVRHATPSRNDQCTGPYKVQLDRVGAMIVWCMDASGAAVSSHSTTSHSRHVESRETFIVAKGAGEMLTVALERRGDRAVIADVY